MRRVPVIAPRFLRNRSVVFASLIGFFDFVRSCIPCLLLPELITLRTAIVLPNIHVPLYLRSGRQAMDAPASDLFRADTDGGLDSLCLCGRSFDVAESSL